MYQTSEILISKNLIYETENQISMLKTDHIMTKNLHIEHGNDLSSVLTKICNLHVRIFDQIKA